CSQDSTLEYSVIERSRNQCCKTLLDMVENISPRILKLEYSDSSLYPKKRDDRLGITAILYQHKDTSNAYPKEQLLHRLSGSIRNVFSTEIKQMLTSSTDCEEVDTKNFRGMILPEGAELTFSELRQMAARQQQQIEAQQQFLVAKEQRLKFLKQQEVKHYRGAQTTERTRLLHLREKVEGQEQKLRRLRALRNHMDQHRVNNSNLGAELESVRALFNEKEKELSLAVAKVEDLTRQLEELRRGNLNGVKTSNNVSLPAALELEKLKRELVYRTKLNEGQNARIAQQRETLVKNHEDVSGMDQRIAELQQRLHRKRMANHQISGQNHAASVAKQAHVRRGSIKTHPHIAVVEEPDRIQNDLEAPLRRGKGIVELGEPANSPRYQILPSSTIFTIKPEKYINNSEESGDGLKSIEDKAHQQTTFVTSSSSTEQVSMHLQQLPTKQNVIPPPPGKPIQPPHHLRPYCLPLRRLPPSRGQCSTNGNSIMQVNSSASNCSIQPVLTNSELPPTLHELIPLPGSQGNSVLLPVSPSRTDMIPQSQSTAPRAEVRLSTSPRHTGSSDSHQSVSARETIVSNISTTTSLTTPSVVKYFPPPLPVRPVPPPRQTHQLAEGNSSSARGYVETSLDSLDSTLSALKAPGNQANKNINGFRYLLKPQTAQRVGRVALDKFAKEIKHLHRNEYPSRSPRLESYNVKDNHLPSSSRSGNSLRSEQEPRREKLPLKPKPLTIRIPPPSTDPPRCKGQQNETIQRQGADGISERISPNWASHNGLISITHQAENISPPSDLNRHIRKRNRSKDQSRNGVTDKGAVEVRDMAVKQLTWNHENTKIPMNLNYQLDHFNGNTTLDSENSVRPDGAGESVNTDNGLVNVNEASTVAFLDRYNRHEYPHIYNSATLRRVKRGNLKTKNSDKKCRKVSFDPLALLLDAALEGELELVKRTAKEVPNTSASNDEGITALHNAVCAGYFEIVKYLVEFGCDVNAQDSDGWTPLHCAASCNNQQIVRFLVEHGACVFATTLSDNDTAAEKCEEDEEGYDGCSEFLYSVQKKLGILNSGAVYAVYDYDAQNQDELSFKDGDMIIVLRKGDEQEREWWWSRHNDREGYIPRNLLGLYPRVASKRDT
ncbi:apoptosis-stimulating of p53 protein 1-like, partial [Limulus polyphemus]|uniref:Apoptosis-stimulating of p53 protein 1-like n=1 Tax=Limulus polyphemus TaxID=6850 RepID=A0ABM1BRA5_LIMPO